MKQVILDNSGKPEPNLYPLWDFLSVEIQAQIKRCMGKDWLPPQYRPMLESLEEIQKIMTTNEDVKC